MYIANVIHQSSEFRFGKAFCASLSDAVCSTNPCDNCPRSRPALISPDIFQKTLADLPCCGDAELCGSLTCKPNIDNILPLSVPAGVRSMETVPCNEAWEALKVHPNIGFAGKCRFLISHFKFENLQFSRYRFKNASRCRFKENFLRWTDRISFQC